ncbi:MAG: dTDP-4-dehydrorhamnose reductase [Bacteroidota bacterium]
MSVKRILLVGSNGLLGQKLTEVLTRGSAYYLVLASRSEKSVRPLLSAEYVQLDVTSRKDVKHLVWNAEPDIIINASAMTNVDACELERELAWKINVDGMDNIIDGAKRNDTRIIHVSTDYIFDGKSGPYSENDRPEPLNYYGKSKLASENSLRTSGLPHMIARTIVLYGYGSGVKSNFALWLIGQLEQKLPVRVVDDQFGNPTLVDDLAYGIVSAIELGRTGVYNIAGREIISRYEFALRLARVFDFDERLITPIQTSQLKQPAVRPLKSGLITLKAELELGIKPSTVEDGLKILKNQLQRTARRAADSPPAPSATPSRPTKR